MIEYDVAAKQVAGANRGWRWPFRCRGSRHELAVARLSKLGGSEHYAHSSFSFCVRYGVTGDQLP